MFYIVAYPKSQFYIFKSTVDVLILFYVSIVKYSAKCFFEQLVQLDDELREGLIILLQFSRNSISPEFVIWKFVDFYKFKFEQKPLFYNLQTISIMIRHILRQGLRTANNGYSSSSEKQKSKEMAICAAETIRYLSSLPIIEYNMKVMLTDRAPQESDESKRVSLSQLIIKNLNDYSSKQVNEQLIIGEHTISKFQEMLDPRFGVELPLHLRDQKRINDGANQNKKFSFFPNRLVTIPIFKIVNKIDDKTLVYGQAGISKTVSFAYYSYLSRMITLYQLEYNEPIALDIPRLLYFSYSTQSNDLPELQSYITSLIQSNFSENIFARYKLDKMTKPLTVYRYLGKICKNMKFKVVVDQFNSFTAQCRNFNIDVEKNSLTKQLLAEQKKWLLNQKDLWFSSAINFTEKRYIYNSSQNVDEQVLGRAQQPKISFNMDHHSKCNRYHINYYNYHHNVLAQREIVHLLFFQLQKMFPQINAQAIKEILLKNNFSFFGESFLTPYQIRQLLRQKPLLKQEQLKKIDWSNQNDAVEKISQLLQEIDQKRISEAIFSAQKFINEGTEKTQEEKIKIVLKARQIIEDRVQEEEEIENQAKNQLSTSINQFLVNPDSQKQIYAQWADIPVNRQNLDKNLFEVVELENEKIKRMVLKFSAKEFLKVTNFIYELILKKSLSSSSIPHSIMNSLMKDDRAQTGRMIDNSIIQMLRSYPLKIRIPLGNGNTKIVNLEKKKDFYHFNSKKNLYDRFQALIPIKNEQVLGLPKKNNDEPTKTSKSIDFIITRKDQKGQLQVYSFDLTVRATKVSSTAKGSKLTIAKNTIKSALDQNRLSKQKQIKIKKWNHIVLCLPQDFQQISVQEIQSITGYNTLVSCYTQNFLDFQIIRANAYISKQKQIQFNERLKALDFLKTLL